MLEKPSQRASSNKRRPLPPYRRSFPEVLRDLLLVLAFSKFIGLDANLTQKLLDFWF